MADDRLVIFDITQSPPVRIDEVMVGVEPVTVRVDPLGRIWVINHVSDSASIIDPVTYHIMRTLSVGDEPTDVAFANNRAFVCVSQRDLLRVYDLNNLDAVPVDIPLAMSDPRSLAVSPDGLTVYVAAHDSGNKTTVVPRDVVAAMGGPPPPNPPKHPTTPPAPEVALVVKHNGVSWQDETAGNWDAAVPYTLLDNDVCAIDAVTLAVTASFGGIGTALFNIAVHPGSGLLYVSNIESFNHIRFEPNLSGQFAHNRVTRVIPSVSFVLPVHLNQHINYGVPEGNALERSSSLSTPLDMAISEAKSEIYVAAFGSAKIGVLNLNATVTRRIDVGQGPAGVAVDESRDQLYVYNRFSSSLSVVDLGDDSSVELSLGYDPSPSNVLDGRGFLYNAENFSAHGDLSCATCHVFGRTDGMVWDLGNPADSVMIPPPPGQFPLLDDFHPMKGPMFTQVLQGLAGTDPFHWRGDREDLLAFNIAFVGLMGIAAEIPSGDMGKFEAFMFSIQYPPNPNRLLDGSMPATFNGADPANGEQVFLEGNTTGGTVDCVDCHLLPNGTNQQIILPVELQQDEGKVTPQLRNLYKKTRFDNQAATTVRGFGYGHDGATDDLESFLLIPRFQFINPPDRADVEAFLMMFDTGTPAAVGVQWTTDGGGGGASEATLDTLESEADGASVGLVAKGLINGERLGWAYAGGGMYTADRTGLGNMSRVQVLSLASPGGEVTFTAVPLGTEWRSGVDRDQDGWRDGDERDAGTDPGDPTSFPVGTGIDTYTSRTPSALWISGANPTRVNARFSFHVGVGGRAELFVYDVKGRLVRRLINDPNRFAGTYQREWDLRNNLGETVSSGVYFVRLRTVDAIKVQRVTVLR